MSKKKDKIEGIKPELLEIAEIQRTDETVVPEGTEVSGNTITVCAMQGKQLTINDCIGYISSLIYP